MFEIKQNITQASELVMGEPKKNYKFLNRTDDVKDTKEKSKDGTTGNRKPRTGNDSESRKSRPSRRRKPKE